MKTFGEMLRAFRQASNDPDRLNRRLSQERLGALIGEEMGDLGVSGTAISYWESGESKISAEDRKLLLALVHVLHKCRGLETLLEANQFFEAGNYRVLNVSESEKIFKYEISKTRFSLLIENLFSVSEEELKTLIEKTREGPKPVWPRVLAALMRQVTDRFSLSLRAILWIWIWLIAWWLITPSLQLPFANQNAAFQAVVWYAAGTLIVPLMIGALINTYDSAYWKEIKKEKSILLRLYTYQGAGIGFNLGYFFALPFSFMLNYLHIEPSILIGIIAATAGLILGNMGARVVPHNLWRAYGRLTWADGAIFFVVALMGPLWAFFFLEFYPVLLNPVTGIIVILLAVTVLVFIATRKSKTHDK